MNILPKTNHGHISLRFFVGFILGIAVFAAAVASGQRGGDTFFSNLWLTLPFLAAYVSAVISFILGIVAIFKKDRSLLLFVITFLSFLITLWGVLELFSSN